MRRLPLESLAFAALLAGASALPPAGLEFAPGRPAWTVLTAQLTHWSAAMAAANAVVVAALGAWLELRSKAAWRRAVLLGAAGVAGWLLLAGRESYRGASGMATALLACASVFLWPKARTLVVLAALLLAGKLGWEASGHAAPVAALALPGGVRVAWEAHLAGALGGLLAARMSRPGGESMRRPLVPIVFAAALASAALAGECPQAVIAASKAAVPDGRITSCHVLAKEDGKPWALRVSTSRGRAFLRVSASGELLRLERESTYAALPAALLSRVAKERPGARIEAVRRVEKGDPPGWIVDLGKEEIVYPDVAELVIRAGKPFEKTFPGEDRLSEIRQLTFGGENAEAYFSPDGTKLIFQATVAPNGCDRQYVMDLTTGGVAQVSSGKGRTTCGYFSYPDGKKIVYASTEAGGDACPAPPDHAKGYVWALYDTYDLWIADADGTNAERITDGKGYDAEATWCHKGGKMIFTSVRDGDLELYERKDDGTITRLTHTPGYDGGAFYSPDCSEIVWRAGRPEGAALEEYRSLLAEGLIRPKNVEIYVAKADGSGAKRLTDNGAANFCPCFTPDSRQVIFASNATAGGREFDLYLVSRDGGPLERVTTAPGFDGFPFFSPDGMWIVWASNRADPGSRDTNLFLARWKP